MALLTVQSAALSGLAESFTAATATTGDTFPEDGKQETFLEVNNGSGASIDVTITAIETSVVVSKVGPVTVTDKTIAVGAGARKIIGPFPKAYVNSAGLVKATCSAVTSVTVRAVRVSRIDGT